MTPELRNRLLIGPALGLLTIVAMVWDASHRQLFGMLLLATVGILSCCREYLRMLRPLAPGVQGLPIMLGSFLLVLVAWPGLGNTLPVLQDSHATMAIIGILLVWTCLVQMARHGTEDFAANLGATILGLAYLGLPLALLMALAASSGTDGRGSQLVLLTLAACKLGDTTAFFGGRLFGRHKMCPGISPGKTWEGFAASLIGSVGGTCLVAWILGLYLPPAFASWWQPALWGLILGPIGVAGDLVESCLKRSAARKDSGTALPGFGGFLDIFDAILLAGPVAYLLARLLQV